MSGGDLVSAYVLVSGIQEHLKEHKDSPVWKLRYTSNGSTLYSVCDGGILRRYRRYPDRHEYLGEVYRHKGDIQDLDISPYDECILFQKMDILTKPEIRAKTSITFFFVELRAKIWILFYLQNHSLIYRF